VYKTEFLDVYKDERKVIMNTAEEALKAMGLTAEEMLDAEEERKEQGRPRRSDPRICLCGHAAARHTTVNGITFCKPARMECPCKNCRPVIEAEDTRKFLRRTDGGGKLHALTRGIVSHIETGKSVKWVVDLKCDRCGQNDENVVPVPVTQSGKGTSYATGYDALLCRFCREEV
jgi:hypothetical protein